MTVGIKRLVNCDTYCTVGNASLKFPKEKLHGVIITRIIHSIPGQIEIIPVRIECMYPSDNNAMLCSTEHPSI